MKASLLPPLFKKKKKSVKEIKVIGKAALYCIEEPPLATAVSFLFQNQDLPIGTEIARS